MKISGNPGKTVKYVFAAIIDNLISKYERHRISGLLSISLDNKLIRRKIFLPGLSITKGEFLSSEQVRTLELTRLFSNWHSNCFQYKGIIKHEMSTPKTILVVDDFEDTQELMKFLINELGYQLLQAKDGWKAVEIVKRQVPDLILMDMALPSVDGIQATKLIRQLQGASKIPIIAFTASGQFIYQRAIDAGCNALLDKPIDIDKLKSIITQYLET